MNRNDESCNQTNSRTDPFLLVVAIDFGTSYSGYAYSSREDFDKNPSQVFTVQPCNSGCANLLSYKTPTCLLLNENQEYQAFGYDAESQYAEICANNDQAKYFYFRRFKTKLYEGFIFEEFLRPVLQVAGLIANLFGLSNDGNDSTHIPVISPAITAIDIGGKTMPAIDVFSLSIKALVNDFIERKKKAGLDFIHSADIKWVLTVPAIWGERAKNFMRRSAIKAGISDKNLSIALEPECASIYCQSLRPEQIFGPSKQFKASEQGCKYMVVDIGGGTVDIAVHEKMEGRKLKELCRATGGDCGGTSVDLKYMEVMEQLFGDAVAAEFKTRDPESFLDLLRGFESMKRTIKPTSKGTIKAKIPYYALSQYCHIKHHITLEKHIESSEFSRKISVSNGHFKIEADFLRSLFVETLEKLNTLISKTFKNERVKDVNTIVLVGGFAECALVQDSVTSTFPEKRVIIPEECGLAVLKGAVMFGHDSSFISLRVLPLTIGIQASKPYNADLGHDRNHVFIHNGKEYSKNIFHIIIERDTDVEVDTKIVKEFSTKQPNQEYIRINVFGTRETNITYIDDRRCRFLGRTRIKVLRPSQELQNIKVVFTFGNTEMSVDAQDPGNDDKYEGRLDFPSDSDDETMPDIILDE